ncbi:MAG TPA: type II toxin-antitoxin system RelE/ParE family toxin [Candidatus Saccharimonadales bacterium]|nr:type II toxin-antitoxin system RelE/ParE family toxin [Candidatus Saccharimonadales bacterium]
MYRDTLHITVIRSFKHAGLEKFFLTGSKAGIQPAHASKLRLQLGRLAASSGPQDMNVSGWRLHRLSGTLKDHWTVTVNGNWRMTFTFEGEDAILVDYQDYH